MKLQHEQGKNIIHIRIDHGKEFENVEFNKFYDEEGIHHEYFAHLIPQQNGVVERKNKTLQEMARVMLHAKKIVLHFLLEALNTARHIHNRITTRSGITITLYELLKGRKPNVKYFMFWGYLLLMGKTTEKHAAEDIGSCFTLYASKRFRN